jgi:hypothetical protein
MDWSWLSLKKPDKVGHQRSGKGIQKKGVK